MKPEEYQKYEQARQTPLAITSRVYSTEHKVRGTVTLIIDNNVQVRLDTDEMIWTQASKLIQVP
jgi:hypothetical protein